MNKLLKDGYDKVAYLVLLEGKVLQRTATEIAADNFVNTLPEDVRAKVRIVPATSDNKEILFG